MESLNSFPVGLFHPLQHAGLSRRSAYYRQYGSFGSKCPYSRHPCKLSRAFGPRNPMKIASIQGIIESGWEWRDRFDSGVAKAECKFDRERA
jgi:hypothetical protein